MKRKPRGTGKGTAPASLPLPSMDEFKTRERANVGHKIPLYTADGRLTGHFIVCRGVDSDSFQRAHAKQTRRLAEIAALDEAEREEAMIEAKVEMQAALVADWSFSDPALMGGDDKTHAPTLENVRRFLRDAPQIGTELDKFASRRSLFFRTGLDSLRNSQGGPLS